MESPPLSEALRRDVDTVQRLSSIPTLLKVVSATTGLRFAAVARVTPASWVACAVYDELGFGIEPGGTLDVTTTLCREVHDRREAIAFDHASEDPVYRDHPTPKAYGLESYVSVPIIDAAGEVFGTICALDPRPTVVNEPRILAQLGLFAELIASQLALEAERERTAALNRRLASFVEAAPVAIAVMRGPELRYEVFNARFQQLVHGRGVIGVPAKECLRDIAGSKVWGQLLGVYTSGAPVAVSEYALELTDNVDGWIDVVAQPTYDEHGVVDGVMVCASDVTTLVRSRDALARKNRELDEFAHVASHDLKSPLRAIGTIAGWIEADAGPLLPPASKEHLQLLQQRVLFLSEVIDGALRFARAERNGRDVASVSVSELVRDIIATLSMPASARVEIAGELPVLTTTRPALHQVFANLVDNAVRHARRDDVHVVVSAARVDGEWTFRVADNGAGIAPADHARVWGLFQTLGGTPTGGSTGIGLSIVKKLVEGNGGRVWIEAAPSGGACFCFTWPVSSTRT